MMAKQEVTMDTESYRFRVGNFKCIAVSDGTHTYAPPDFPPPATLLFSNAPGESLEPALLQHNLPAPWAAWTSPYICLVVDTGKHLILVDTGAGNLAPTTGRLLKNLKAERITPGDIDTVIITHGHPDHLGGNTDKDGKPAFPDARYILWKDEWDFWTSGKAERKLEGHSREILLKCARQNLPPIQGQLDLVDHETEIVPGISAVAAPGHTPGHMALAISSKNERLLCISDVVLHPIHLEHPEWCSVFDIVPELIGVTRRKLLDRAAAEKALVIAFHFPFPGLGHVLLKGKAWQWQPAETATPA
jgi:glyoxylase-like metal-dependent hydrolase (beta-lactamase superfamily II)